jgi:hypothetical protein
MNKEGRKAGKRDEGTFLLSCIPYEKFCLNFRRQSATVTDRRYKIRQAA